jgi:hypothetical protein
MANLILGNLGIAIMGTGLWIKEPWIALAAVGATLYANSVMVFLVQWFGRGSRQ